MSLQGKIALITGGTGGFGKAFATELLKARASAVCLIDIADNGHNVASKLSEQFPPSKVDFMRCDVTDYSAYKNIFDTIKKKYGFVDIVCNNAGISCIDADFEKSVLSCRLNFEAVFYGTRLGQEFMDKTEGGRGGVIINIASMAAFNPIQGSMVYTGTKSGVVGLSQAASLDYESNGVRVNALCPSFSETPILDSIPGYREAIKQIQPILPAEFVAEGFINLVTDDSLNGKVMRVTPQKGIDFYREPRHNFRTSKL